jgi:hypothetical protein
MIVKKAPGILSEKPKEASRCESCGNDFFCGAVIKGCWCMKIKLSDEARSEIKAKFKNCLCRDCLKKYTSGQKK